MDAGPWTVDRGTLCVSPTPRVDVGGMGDGTWAGWREKTCIYSERGGWRGSRSAARPHPMAATPPALRCRRLAQWIHSRRPRNALQTRGLPKCIRPTTQTHPPAPPDADPCVALHPGPAPTPCSSQATSVRAPSAETMATKREGAPGHCGRESETAASLLCDQRPLRRREAACLRELLPREPRQPLQP